MKCMFARYEIKKGKISFKTVYALTFAVSTGH
nr:MAG TPA: hypothetical protein [Caudoviricetes sp.]